MSVPLTTEHLAQLKVFVQLCMANPSILHQPDLSFVKIFIEHFGGKIPEDKSADSSADIKCEIPKKSEPEVEPKVEPEPESEESDLELDMTGVIEPDTDAPQKMGNPTLQPTEEEIAESQTKRTEAISAFGEKDYEKAIQLYTEAIVLNPQTALLYAKRGQVYLLLNKPNACIRDCDRALELNPDSAAAHKFRGRAYQLLGKFEEAANDLRLACKFDFDEQADEWLREVTPNARKIEEHKRKKERKIQEKLGRERQEKLSKAKENVKANEFYKLLTDPEIFKSLEDPEIEEAFKEILSNPVNIFKYQSNPKIMGTINKIATQFGGVSGIPGFPGATGGMPGFGGTTGGMPGFGGTTGGMPGFPGAADAQPSAPKTKPENDVGLD